MATACILWIVAFIPRLFAILTLRPEFWEYETIVHNLLHGKGFTYPHLNTVYRSYCEPLYPILNAGVYACSNNNVLAMELMQAVFSAGIAVVIYALGLRLFNRPTAILASLLAAFHPGLIVYTTKLHPLVFDSFFMCLALFTMVRLCAAPTTKNLLVAGLVTGVCMMTRPTILAFAPLALAYCAIKNSIGFTRAIKALILFFLCVGVLATPWAMRNARVQKQFMLTRSNTPFVFWLGNCPYWSGSAMTKEKKSIFDSAPAAFKETIYSLDEKGQNQAFMKEAQGYVRQHPVLFLKRTILKLYYFWWYTPLAGMLYPALWFKLYWIYYCIMLVFAIVGGIISRCTYHARPERVLTVIFLAAISLSQSFFYIETRHRWGIEPVLLIFCAAGIMRIATPLLMKGKSNEDH